MSADVVGAVTDRLANGAVSGRAAVVDLERVLPVDLPIGVEFALARYLASAAPDAEPNGPAESADEWTDLLLLIAAGVALRTAEPDRVPRAVRSLLDGIDSLDDPAAWSDHAADLADDDPAGRCLTWLAAACLPGGDPRRTIAVQNLVGLLVHAHDADGDPWYLDHAIRCAGPALDELAPDDAHRSGLLRNVALAVHERALGTDSDPAGHEAAGLLRAAIDAATDPEDRYSAEANLAGVLRAAAERTGDTALATEAIVAARAALEGAPAGHPRRPARLAILSSALRTRTELVDDPAASAELVAIAGQAAALSPPDGADHAAVLSAAGNAAFVHYQDTADPDSLDAAVDLLTRAVDATPPGRPAYRLHLGNLALALTARAERGGDPGALRAAVDAARRAVDATPIDAPDRGGCLTNYGIALRVLAERTHDDEALALAVDAAGQAVAATPTDHPDRPGYLNNLSTVLHGRALRTGSASDLDQAVETAAAALDGVPPGHPDRPRCLTTLAVAELERAEWTGDPVDRDRAVTHARAAVEQTPPDAADAAPRWTNLGLALRVRYEHTGRLADLREAVTAGAEAVGVGESAGAYLQAGRWSNLSLAQRALGERTGDAALVEAALAAADRAVSATPADHPDRPGYLSNRGLAHSAAYDRTGVAGPLTAAIDDLTEAVRLTAVGDPARPGRLVNLAGVLRDRFRRSGDDTDLDRAVALDREATRDCPTGKPDRGRYLTDLAASLTARYERDGAVGDLDQARAFAREASAAVPEHHADRAVVLHDIAMVFQAHHARTALLDSLVDAVYAARAAVAAVPADAAARPMILGGLANTLQVLHSATGDTDALREAVAADRAAVDALPARHPDRPVRLSNLSIGLRSLHERTGDQDAATTAVEAAAEAVALIDPDSPLAAIVNYVHGEALTTADPRTIAAPAAALAAYRRAAALPVGAPTVRIRAATEAGRLAADAGSPPDGLHDLTKALDLLDRAVPRTTGRGDQEHRIGQFGGLASDAAACAIRTGDPRHAVRLLEQGRGVLLARALDARADLVPIEQHAPDLVEPFDRLRRAVDVATLDESLRVASGQPGASDTETRAALVADLDAMLAQIRARPGLHDHGRPPELATLQAATTGGAVALVNVSTLGSHVLLVSPGAVTERELPDLGVGELGAQVARFQAAVTAEPCPDEPTVREILAWLWSVVGEPVLAHVRRTLPGLRRLWWSATGPMALLPLHAAGGVATGWVMDHLVCSYTPTIRALAHARRPPDVNADAPAGQVLVVSMPTTPGLTDLPGADTETRMLTGRFGAAARVLTGRAATRTEVLAALPSYRWAHLACHATVHHREASRSLLAVSDHQDRPLTVADLSALRLPNAELAYLSACDSASTVPRLADEGIHLVSAFQLAGYRHAIGTLWPVASRRAVRMARDVYAAIPPNPGSDVAAALHGAVLALRHDWPQHPSVWAAYIHSGR